AVIMASHIETIKKILAPTDDDVTVHQRKAARRSSGAVQRSLKVTCYPGRTQLENLVGEKVAMSDFPKEEGDYTMVIDLAAIDASLEQGIITYGITIYGRALRVAAKVERQPLAWREDVEEEEAAKEGEAVELPDE